MRTPILRLIGAPLIAGALVSCGQDIPKRQVVDMQEQEKRVEAEVEALRNEFRTLEREIKSLSAYGNAVLLKEHAERVAELMNDKSHLESIKAKLQSKIDDMKARSARHRKQLDSGEI